MSVLVPDARTEFRADLRTAPPMSMRSALVLWLAGSAQLWIGIIQLLRTLF